jgi:hypothetical protein
VSHLYQKKKKEVIVTPRKAYSVGESITSTNGGKYNLVKIAGHSQPIKVSFSPAFHVKKNIPTINEQ